MVAVVVSSCVSRGIVGLLSLSSNMDHDEEDKDGFDDEGNDDNGVADSGLEYGFDDEEEDNGFEDAGFEDNGVEDNGFDDDVGRVGSTTLLATSFFSSSVWIVVFDVLVVVDGYRAISRLTYLCGFIYRYIDRYIDIDK